MASKDLRPIVKGWPYVAGQITVRKIAGRDRSPKIQMRLDLGVLQMEATGRPDGRRPHEHESLLDYHVTRLAEYERRNGTQLGFMLTPDECRELRDEAVMYYYRYLALFVLEEFDSVERDTARNLQVLEICREFAAETYDRYILEQYRPYILMMNTRAKAHAAMSAKTYRAALAQVDSGLKAIREFFESVGHGDSADDANEVDILRELRRHILDSIPNPPLDDLRTRLRHAVEHEEYEEAARLRDQIRKMENSSG